MKNYKLYIIPIVFFVAILFSNCSITKRNYRSGYYVTWNKKIVERERFKYTFKQVTNGNNPIVVSVNNNDGFLFKRKEIKLLMLNPDTCGDLILKIDGEEIIGKIVEINPEVIKYKKCVSNSDTLHTTDIKDVFMVKYSNGNKELFRKEKNKITQSAPIEQEVKTKKPKKYSGFAIGSASTGILALTMFLSPIPFILGIIGIIQINKNPQKYKGMVMAILGTIIGAIGLLLLIIIISSAIASI